MWRRKEALHFIQIYRLVCRLMGGMDRVKKIEIEKEIEESS